MNYYRNDLSSPIGLLTLRCSETALTGLWIHGQKHHPQLQDALCYPSHPILLAAEAWLNDYFAGKNPDPHRIPISFSGSPFQIAVWEQLRSIPYGQTVSYQYLADKLGKTGAYQAIGGAVGRNPVSVIVPCHRVIGKNGTLTGFAGGLDAKKFLLDLEALSNPTLIPQSVCLP